MHSTNHHHHPHTHINTSLPSPSTPIRRASPQPQLPSNLPPSLTRHILLCGSRLGRTHALRAHQGPRLVAHVNVPCVCCNGRSERPFSAASCSRVSAHACTRKVPDWVLFEKHQWTLRCLRHRLGCTRSIVAGWLAGLQDSARPHPVDVEGTRPKANICETKLATCLIHGPNRPKSPLIPNYHSKCGWVRNTPPIMPPRDPLSSCPSTAV